MSWRDKQYGRTTNTVWWYVCIQNWKGSHKIIFLLPLIRLAMAINNGIVYSRYAYTPFTFYSRTLPLISLIVFHLWFICVYFVSGDNWHRIDLKSFQQKIYIVPMVRTFRSLPHSDSIKKFISLSRTLLPNRFLYDDPWYEKKSNSNVICVISVSQHVPCAMRIVGTGCNKTERKSLTKLVPVCNSRRKKYRFIIWMSLFAGLTSWNL